ncbi:MAG: hypothetical protein ACKVT2_20330 [Saprospiraceae bacterium]
MFLNRTCQHRRFTVNLGKFQFDFCHAFLEIETVVGLRGYAHIPPGGEAVI